MKTIKEFCKPHYDEPHRYYHNWQHIIRMLNLLDEHFFKFNGLKAKDLNSLRTAICFHDIVYNPKAADSKNVFDSILEFNEFMKTLDHESIIENELCEPLIMSLIHATDYSHRFSHDLPEQDLYRIITDLDLSILAAPKNEYNTYAANIRKEYSYYNDDEYKIGRTNVLHKMLEPAKAGKLFYHLLNFNSLAVKNITNEINILKNN